MSDPTEKATRYAQALADVLRGFEVLEEDAGWFERQLIRLLRVTYRQRLQVFESALRQE